MMQDSIVGRMVGAILPTIRSLDSLPCWHQALELLKPVEDDDDFLAGFSCSPASLDHHKSLAGVTS